MGKVTNAIINEKYNYQDANYYHLPERDYYEPDAFNQLEDLAKVFHVQNYAELQCQYYENRFLLNNKLHKHL